MGEKEAQVRGLDWKGVTRWEEARACTETLRERHDSKSKDRPAGPDQTQILTVAKCQIFYKEQLLKFLSPIKHVLFRMLF